MLLTRGIWCTHITSKQMQLLWIGFLLFPNYNITYFWWWSFENL